MRLVVALTDLVVVASSYVPHVYTATVLSGRRSGDGSQHIKLLCTLYCIYS